MGLQFSSPPGASDFDPTNNASFQNFISSTTGSGISYSSRDWIVRRNSGPWEITELVQSTLRELKRYDVVGLTPLPFTLEDIDSLARRLDNSNRLQLEPKTIFALKKGEAALLEELCDTFNIDPSQPHAACPDLFGEVSERVRISSPKTLPSMAKKSAIC